mgnify:FL=1
MTRYNELRDIIKKIHKIDLNDQSIFRIGIIKYYYNLEEFEKLYNYIKEVVINER